MPTSDSSPSTLIDFASSTRRMLEPGLERSAAGVPISTGACLYASFLVASLWNTFHGGGATVRGGDGDLQEGARDAQGRWLGHYWCEVPLAQRRYIVDITADQFGHEAVRVLPHEAATGVHYRAGDQSIVDIAVRDLAASFGLDPAVVAQWSRSDQTCWRSATHSSSSLSSSPDAASLSTGADAGQASVSRGTSTPW